MAAVPPLDTSIVREIADILGATESGLTNREIDELLRAAGIEDPNPKTSNPYVFRAISKRDRLFAALDSRQAQDRAANAVLRFILCAMRPIRFRDKPGA